MFKKIFLIALLAVCLVPAAAFALFGSAAPRANEVLSPKPRWITENEINVHALEDTKTYLDDHYGFRSELITADAFLNMKLFGRSVSENVLIGQNGWLYYAPTLDDYTGSTSVSDRQIFCEARTLALMQQYAASQNAAMCFAAVPNKNSVCGDNMPQKYEKSADRSHLLRLQEELKRQSVTYCDLFGAFEKSGGELYYQTDSHWTEYGSAFACRQILQCLQREDTVPTHSFAPKPHVGDLYRMLLPAGNQPEYAPGVSDERAFRYDADFRSAEDQTICTSCDSQDGTLLMYRDSFGNALHCDVAECFASATFSRQMPYDLTALAELQADTLIVEIVERNLSWLTEKPPVFPAPVCPTPAFTHKAAEDLPVSVTDCELEGMRKYTASFAPNLCDTDSPIFLLLDGTAYEAIPQEDGFAAYAPEADYCGMVIRQNGTLLLFSLDRNRS